ncbi:MAG: UDP-3-O-[3-hydroxymyristoyl] N-acetylglucosamine deacetylase [Parvicellaceae bacterium]|jgi:UDP-3-O-[3-hydroxymyristoyl] N-acetylglucosamine deacetylase/3-hydroxyacyl-[acyl-carrier-protein] dehydratase
MSDFQTTLKEEIKLSGVGLHTGEIVNITIVPAKANYGYKFQRMDLEGQPVIKADADLVISTERGTTLEKNGVRIYTTEHILASLYGMRVDNVLIQLDGPEIPIMDGSAYLFVEAIKKAGKVELEEKRDYFEFQMNQPYEDLDKGIEMLAVPYEEFRLTVMVDYNSPVLGTQHAGIYSLDDFEAEIAPCRTFVFLKELEQLAKAGLIKGGDIDNAIVLVERDNIPEEELAELAKLLGKEHLEIDLKGIGTLNNAELKFVNEPARHKLLDIIGDLALVGKPIKGHILAARPGHSGNVSFAQIIKKIMIAQKGKRYFDLTKPPLYDINDISKMLPHRYPFLLIDKIMSISDEGIIGVKNVTMNEPFFTGHFPGNPVMPGVLQIEAMAQIGGIFALSKVDEPEKYMTYFMKIDNVRFKKKVIPGDTVVFDLELLTPIRRGIVHMKGIAYTNGEPALEAEMMAQIVKETE